VERQIDRLLLGTDANGGGNSFTNLASINSSNVTARSVTLGGESRTEWPASAAALNLIAGSNIVIAVDGTNYTLHVPSLPWAAISGAPSFDTAGTALAQQQNLSNTVNSIFGATGLANTNYFAASNWVLTVSATDMMNLSNTVFNYGFLTATSTQSIFQLGAPNVITATNTHRATEYFNDAIRIQRNFSNASDTVFAVQTPGAASSMARLYHSIGTGIVLRLQGFEQSDTNGTINWRITTQPITNTTVAGFGVSNGVLTGAVASAEFVYSNAVEIVVSNVTLNVASSYTFNPSNFLWAVRSSNAVLKLSYSNLRTTRSDTPLDSMATTWAGVGATNCFGEQGGYSIQSLSQATRSNAVFAPCAATLQSACQLPAGTSGTIFYRNIFNTNSTKTFDGFGGVINGNGQVGCGSIFGCCTNNPTLYPSLTYSSRFSTGVSATLMFSIINEVNP
jgi:hypothetical protein